MVVTPHHLHLGPKLEEADLDTMEVALETMTQKVETGEMVAEDQDTQI